jgi:hypothetical protein
VRTSLSSGLAYYKTEEEVYPEYSELIIDLKITDRGVTWNEPIHARLYINYGYIAHPLIISTIYGDLYFYLDSLGSTYETLVQEYASKQVTLNDFYIIGEEVPLIYAIWVGLILMVAGSLVPVVYHLIEFIMKKNQISDS